MRDSGLQSGGASLCDLPQVLINRIVEAALETMKPKEAARLATVRMDLLDLLPYCKDLRAMPNLSTNKHAMESC